MLVHATGTAVECLTTQVVRLAQRMRLARVVRLGLSPVDLSDSAGRGELRVGSDLERGAVATRSPRAPDETPTTSADEPEEVRESNPRRCKSNPRRCMT